MLGFLSSSKKHKEEEQGVVDRPTGQLKKAKGAGDEPNPAMEPETILRFVPAGSGESAENMARKGVAEGNAGGQAAAQEGAAGGNGMMSAEDVDIDRNPEKEHKLHNLLHPHHKQNSVEKEVAAAAMYGLSSPTFRTPKPRTQDASPSRAPPSPTSARTVKSSRGYGSAPTSPRFLKTDGESASPHFAREAGGRGARDMERSKDEEQFARGLHNREDWDLQRSKDEELVWESGRQGMSPVQTTPAEEAPVSPRLAEYKTPMVLPVGELSRDPSLQAAKTPVDHVHHRILNSTDSFSSSSLDSASVDKSASQGLYGEMEAVSGDRVIRHAGFESTLAPELRGKSYSLTPEEETMGTEGGSEYSEDVRKAAMRPLSTEEVLPGSPRTHGSQEASRQLSSGAFASSSIPAGSRSMLEEKSDISPKLGEQEAAAAAPFGSMQETPLPPAREEPKGERLREGLQAGGVATAASAVMHDRKEEQSSKPPLFPGDQVKQRPGAITVPSTARSQLWEEHKATEATGGDLDRNLQLVPAAVAEVPQPKIALKPPPGSPVRSPVRSPVKREGVPSEGLVSPRGRELALLPAGGAVAGGGIVEAVEEKAAKSQQAQGGQTWTTSGWSPSIKEQAIERAHEDRVVTEVKAWEEAQNTKHMGRYKTKEQKALALERELQAKADAKFQAKEQKLARIRAKYEEEKLNKYAEARRKAAGLTAEAEEERRQKDAEIHEKATRFLRTGGLPKKTCGCFGGP